MFFYLGYFWSFPLSIGVSSPSDRWSLGFGPDPVICLGHLDLVLIQFALVVLGLVLSQYSLFIWGRSWPSIVWLSPLPRTCACWWVNLRFWSFTWAFPWLCEAFPLSYVWGRSRLVRWLNRCGCSSSSAFCAVSRAPFSPPLNDHRL